MTYTTMIVLNALFAVLVLGGLARIVWHGLRPEHRVDTAAPALDEPVEERLAA